MALLIIGGIVIVVSILGPWLLGARASAEKTRPSLESFLLADRNYRMGLDQTSMFDD